MPNDHDSYLVFGFYDEVIRVIIELIGSVNDDQAYDDDEPDLTALVGIGLRESESRPCTNLEHQVSSGSRRQISKLYVTQCKQC